MTSCLLKRERPIILNNGRICFGETVFEKEMEMSIVAWLFLGLVAGFIASKIINKSGEGLLVDIGLGIVGAVVGGFLFSFFGAAPVTGFNIYSMFVAVVGAIVVLLIYHAITGRGRDTR